MVKYTFCTALIQQSSHSYTLKCSMFLSLSFFINSVLDIFACRAHVSRRLSEYISPERNSLKAASDGFHNRSHPSVCSHNPSSWLRNSILISSTLWNPCTSSRQRRISCYMHGFYKHNTVPSVGEIWPLASQYTLTNLAVNKYLLLGLKKIHLNEPSRTRVHSPIKITSETASCSFSFDNLTDVFCHCLLMDKYCRGSFRITGRVHLTRDMLKPAALRLSSIGSRNLPWTG